MSMKKRGIKVLTTAVALVAGLLIGSFAFSSIPILASTNQSDYTNSSPVFKVNKHEETYGSIKDVNIAGQEPDLILAEGTNGTQGYIKFKDITKNQPKTLEEAKAYDEKLRQDKDKGSEEIPLYDVDGEKVIGKFLIQNPYSAQ